MSVNNLAEQLSWLIHSKSHLPPRNALFGATALRSETEEPVEHQDSFGAELPQRDGSEQQDFGDCVTSAVRSLAFAVQPSFGQGAQNMARLRSPSHSTVKPSLPSQQTRPNEAFASDAAGNNDPLPQNMVNSEALHIDTISPTTSSTPALSKCPCSSERPSSKRVFKSSLTLQTVDLTLDSQEAPCHAPLHNTHNPPTNSDRSTPHARIDSLESGRKRKSEEFESDLLGKTNAPLSHSLHVKRKALIDEFASIDDVLDPHPPYSSNESRQSFMYSHLTPFNATSGKPPGPLQTEVPPSPSSSIQKRVISPQQNPKTLLDKRHSAATEVSQEVNGHQLPPLPESLLSETAINDEAIKVEAEHNRLRVSPDKPLTLSPGGANLEWVPPKLSAEEKSLIERFSNWPVARFHIHRLKLVTERKVINEAILEALEESLVQPPELAATSQHYVKRIKATDDLVQIQRSYLDLSSRRGELRSRIMVMVEQGADTSKYTVDIQANQAVARSLRLIESDVIHLLKLAELDKSGGYFASSADISKQTQEPILWSTPTAAICSDLTVAHVAPPNEHSTHHARQIQPSQSVEESPLRQRKADRNVSIGRPYTYPKVRSKLSKSPEKPSGLQAPPFEATRNACDAFSQDGFDDDDVLFTTHMGSPPAQMEADDEDFDGDHDLEDVLTAEDFESIPAIAPPTNTLGRQVLSESRGNYMIPPRFGSKSESAIFQKRLKDPISSSAKLLPQYPWSADVNTAMLERFYLRGFRPNQLEAINATLGGRDTFVLMPTGGGKSLCYQLPAVICSGKTRGITVVISPLLSLMEDQVDHLKELNIQACLINGGITADERRIVMSALRDPNAEQLIQLLYVTPEMLSKNQAIIKAFQALHTRNLLARIVIDEAHCVSQWGHDFRPDYKALGEVRKQFVGVPVMALTATATENVKIDVMHNLNIEGCAVFAQSFNRPNLTYEVRPKVGKVLEDIADMINKKYRHQSGIIYCLSRKGCEAVAAKLEEKYHVKAHYYHADMKPAEKCRVQRAWQAGEYHVIVATIAFGMGIDKSDVRFVIHHSIPKSLEGYYQETGRAGRDGMRSGCYLYYGYKDTNTLKKMIKDGDGSWEQKERQLHMLRNMIQFSENRSDCRRVQVLAYFGESFSREDCQSACDNCKSDSTFETQDFTEHAASAISMVKKIQTSKVTLPYCVDLFRGRQTKKNTDAKHRDIDEFGLGSSLERNDVERMFQSLLNEDALKIDNVLNGAGFATQYIQLGKRCHQYHNGKRRLRLEVRKSPNRKDKQRSVEGKSKPKAAKPKLKSRTGVGAILQDDPISTNVSSPVRQIAIKNFPRSKTNNDNDGLVQNGCRHDSLGVSDRLVEDKFCDFGDENDDGSDAFEPVRVAGNPTKQREIRFGEPITSDPELDKLPHNHQMLISDFVIRARPKGQKIMMEKGLRAPPFSDTILRRMATDFPQSESQLLQIPGIDPDKVELYGKVYLPLIKQMKEYLEELEHQDEDRPHDPNRTNVINLVSEDEEYIDEHQGDESEGSSKAASQEERSSYFQTTSAAAAFNAAIIKAQASRAKSPRPKIDRNNGNGKSNAGISRKRTYKQKRLSNGMRGKPPGRARQADSPSNRGGLLANTGRGIGMMPTT